MVSPAVQQAPCIAGRPSGDGCDVCGCRGPFHRPSLLNVQQQLCAVIARQGRHITVIIVTICVTSITVITSLRGSSPPTISPEASAFKCHPPDLAEGCRTASVTPDFADLVRVPMVGCHARALVQLGAKLAHMTRHCFHHVTSSLLLAPRALQPPHELLPHHPQALEMSSPCTL